jgi:hypothetical protein
MKADTPISLANLTQMSPEEREMLLLNIRERRLKPVKVYEELTLMQAEARREGLEKQWAKQLEMFARELERADKALDKLQSRHTKLRAIELELEAI